MKSEICSSVLPSVAARTFSFSVDPEFVATLCPNIKKNVAYQPRRKETVLPTTNKGGNALPCPDPLPIATSLVLPILAVFPPNLFSRDILPINVT